MQYRPEIDGLRAVAVIPVIFFHAGFETFSGGFVGVDVFFVISGYLITTIIVSELDAGTFTLRSFYERRARRILPALFFVITCCIPVAWFTLTPNDMKDFAQSVFAAATFSSNILFWRESGYFATAAELKPLLHTWSLAVEEQYYILFPLFMIVAWRYFRTLAPAFLALVFLLSFALSQYAAYNHPAANFYLLPTRGWELLIGVFIALYIDRIILSHRASSAISALGIALILIAVFTFNQSTPFPSVYALVPTVGTALVIAGTRTNSFITRLLESRPSVTIGILSYSLYLWHQPLLAFTKHLSLKSPTSSSIVLALGSTLILSILTQRFIERPARRTGKLARFKVALSLAAVFFIAFGLSIHINNGNFVRNPDLAESLDDALRVNHGLDRECEGQYTDSPACITSEEPVVAVWGDSYAMHLIQGLTASAPENTGIRQYTVSVCGPFMDAAPLTGRTIDWAEKCLLSNELVMASIEQTESFRHVILASPFGQYVNQGEELLLRNGDVVVGADTAAEQLRNTIEHLHTLDLNVTIVGPPAKSGYNTGNCLRKAAQRGLPLDVCNFRTETSEAIQGEVFSFLRSMEGITDVVFLSDRVCSGGECKASLDGVFLYRDGGHLSHAGSAKLGREINLYDLVTE